MRYCKGTLLSIAVFFASSFTSFSLYGVFMPLDSKTASEVVFEIERGEGGTQIAKNLKLQGLIRSEFLFHLYTFATGASSRLQAGEYALSPSLSTAGIVGKLSGGRVIEYQIRILEGWNLHSIGNYLEERGIATKEELFFYTGVPGEDYRKNTEFAPQFDFTQQFALLKTKPSYVSLEGYLFPDTYHISKEEGVKTLVQKMLANFERQLESHLQSDGALSGRDLFETLTMASIIEREVPHPKDKTLIAGILSKRLENSMRLQVDATIVYVREQNPSDFVSIEETQLESPYNTYRVDGLPLGPISNPGLESIIAAVQPKESPYWYYLSAANGETIYSKTFEEHKTAKATYLR